MKAVVWKGDRTVTIETVEDARIEAPSDVLMHISSTAICGTDLHIYEGSMGEVNGMVIGHEPLGTVVDVGSAVASIKKGDGYSSLTTFAGRRCLQQIRPAHGWVYQSRP